MDLLSIIVTAGVASVVTLIANLIIQGSQYRKDFYRKIMDKRIEAYKELDNLICHMSVSSNNSQGEKYLSCLYNKQNYLNLIDLFSVPFSYSMWFTVKISQEFTKLNVILIESMGMNIENVSDDEMHARGIRNYSRIAEQRYTVSKLIYEDVSKIYKVKKFLKEKRTKRIEPILANFK
jgi:hypothetical protein